MEAHIYELLVVYIDTEADIYELLVVCIDTETDIYELLVVYIHTKARAFPVPEDVNTGTGNNVYYKVKVRLMWFAELMKFTLP